MKRKEITQEQISRISEIEVTLDKAIMQLGHSEIAFKQWFKLAKKFIKSNPELLFNDLLPNKFNETLMKHGVIKEPIIEIVRNKQGG